LFCHTESDLDSDDSDYGSKKKKKKGFRKRKRSSFVSDFDARPSLRNRGDRKSYADPDENEDLDEDEKQLIREQKQRAESMVDDGGDVIETVLDSRISEGD